MEKFLTWLGAAVAGGVIIWLCAFGVLLPVEAGLHLRAAFTFPGGNAWWVAVPVLGTAAWGFGCAVTIGERKWER